MHTLTIQNGSKSTATLISNEFIDKYMPKANGEFVKVYLYFLRCCSCPDLGIGIENIADTLCMTESDILRALRYWEQEGLLRLFMQGNTLLGLTFLSPKAAGSTEPSKAPAFTHSEELRSQPAPALDPGLPSPGDGKGERSLYNGTPLYTPDELDHFRQNSGEQLFFVLEQYLGKPLGPTDVNIIIFISEQLGFSKELIEYLFEYCVSNNHYSIHYIEKTAIGWSKAGIDTVAKARAHCTYYNKTSFDILKAFGIRNRNPAKSEIEYIRRWTQEYGFPLNIILEACNRTMEATHAPSFSYAQSILKRWYDHKVGSLEDIQKLDKAHEKQQQETAEKQAAAPGAAKGSKSNKFHNFDQRSYNYSDIEKALLEKATKKPTQGR